MEKEEKRYDRQTILTQWDEGTQDHLGDSRVIIVGCGALGTNTQVPVE
ncbi:hypothetical protein K9M78_08640 [Candidatus Bipolaricaulota bacterium]|nr:hypothetical protein [Candidatus Bipolaricaulota bacterium]